MRFPKFLRILALACILTLVGVFATAAPALAAGAIGISLDSGTPGTTITVWGTGWGGTEAVVIYWDTTVQLGTAICVAGQFSNSNIVIPSTATAGAHTITAWGASSGFSNSVTFTVTASMTMTPLSGPVSTTVTVIGSGFAPNTSIPFYWDGGTVSFATLTASNAGVLNGTITIPSAARRGAHTISTGIAGVPTSTFNIQSKITLNPKTAGTGDSITVTGSGFAAGPQNPITIYVDGNAVTTTPSAVNSLANGSFTAQFVVPTLARGLHTVTASDALQAEDTFTVAEKVTFGASNGFVGDSVTVSGNGFDASASVGLYWGAATTPFATLTASGSGVLSGAFTVPTAVKGDYTVTVKVGTTTVNAVVFTVKSKITAVSPASGTVGTTIKVSGNGFAANTASKIYLGTTEVGSLTTGADGTFTDATFTIPEIGYGEYIVKVADTAAADPVKPVKVNAKLVLSPVSGVAGDTITVTGTGFAASTTASLFFDNTYTLGVSKDTSDKGSFSATFTIPNLPGGAHTISANASNSTASVGLTIGQKITINPASGVSGDTITVNGTGFAAGRQISLTYNGAPVTPNSLIVMTNEGGAFAAAFTAPKSAAGNMEVKASDGVNSATAAFAARANASISKTTSSDDQANVGMELTVSGNGFKPSSAISVTIEGAAAQIASKQSDAQGSFSVTFKVPAVSGGEHILHVSDGTTVKDFTIFVDNAAPTAPAVPVWPRNFHPKQPVPFSWNGASDASGVTYELQLSQETGFTNLILSKKGLTATTYTMTEAEKLKSSGKAPYMWRVRAIDGAGNVGAWSEVNSFGIGLQLPSWMIHVWYGLGILVALVLGLWLGRRAAYQSY